MGESKQILIYTHIKFSHDPRFNGGYILLDVFIYLCFLLFNHDFFLTFYTMEVSVLCGRGTADDSFPILSLFDSQ